jgi:hypothetical protein
MEVKPYCAFTGPRELDWSHYNQVLEVVKAVSKYKQIVTGCARGLDAMVVDGCYSIGARCIKFNRRDYLGGKDIRSLVARSMDMVKKTKESGKGCGLIAFPNNFCPEVTSPSNSWAGGGSGTWSTVAYAVGNEIPVVVFPMGCFSLPRWEAGHWTEAGKEVWGQGLKFVYKSKIQMRMI